MSDSEKQKQTVFKENNGDEKSSEDKQTQSGLEENLAGALCYIAWFITGIIFLLIEKENRFVRFHALQSIITSVGIFAISIVLSFIPVIGWILSLLIAPVTFGLWLFLMWKAYKGETFKLPFVGDMAEKQLEKGSS